MVINIIKFGHLSVTLGIFLATINLATGADFSGNIGLEGRLFQHDGSFTGQQGNSLSLSIHPEFRHKWDQDKKSFTFIPFYRWDGKDDERTHGDIRQLDLIVAKDNWEFQGGISKVFWGVTESQHLVDIINQTDLVEGLDGEDKLGQPMIRVSRLMDDGSLDFFVLPYFRERTFPGESGRFRFPLSVDSTDPLYESSDKEKHVDYALRLNKTIEDFDVGLSYFDGTSRAPEFLTLLENNLPVLKPYYPLIQQFGLDLQYTTEEIVWKLEAINRRFDDNKIKDFSAAVGGFEYSIPGITEEGGDLGLLAEYHRDSRNDKSLSPFQNDLFLGVRLALNDVDGSELLAGAFFDLDNSSKSLRVEASRRLGKGFKINLEGQVFTDVDDNDSTAVISNDDYLQIELQKYF